MTHLEVRQAKRYFYFCGTKINCNAVTSQRGQYS